MNKRKKRKIKKIILRIMLLMLIALPISARIIVEPYRESTFYTEETTPKSFGDWVDLFKYSANSLLNKDMFKTSYSDLEKYNEPAWDYFLEKNHMLNNNYHADLTLVHTGSIFKFDIDVDENIAKVALNIIGSEYDDNGVATNAFANEHVWYMELKDGVVTSYTQDETGSWLMTKRGPFIKGCVAFDIEGMLKSLSELEPANLPYYNCGMNFPEKPDEYGDVQLSVCDLVETADYESAPKITVHFPNYKDYGYKVSEIRRDVFSLADFVDETNVKGKDKFLDYLCDNYNITFKNASLMFSQYDAVTVTLPSEIKNAEYVKNFQFMTDNIVETFGAYWPAATRK